MIVLLVIWWVAIGMCLAMAGVGCWGVYRMLRGERQQRAQSSEFTLRSLEDSPLPPHVFDREWHGL